jgi:hypothetical protein
MSAPAPLSPPEPSPADVESARIRAAIWERQHAREAAHDAVACAKAGLDPHPMMSLGLRRKLGLDLAATARGAALFNAHGPTHWPAVPHPAVADDGGGDG